MIEFDEVRFTAMLNELPIAVRLVKQDSGYIWRWLDKNGTGATLEDALASLLRAISEVYLLAIPETSTSSDTVMEMGDMTDDEYKAEQARRQRGWKSSYPHTYWKDKVRATPDQEVIDRYTQEMTKLKTLNQWRSKGKPGKRPCNYANIGIMNLCKWELDRRGLPIPQVNPSEGETGK